MDTVMKCFYHGDGDGKCAGFWVALSAGLTDTDKYEPKFIEINYDKKFPFDIIGQDEQVYIVDYSIEPDEMRRLLDITKDVTWIDHHKTAIDKYKDFEYDIRGVRYDGVAACMLTYCYLHWMTERGKGDIKPFWTGMTDIAPMFTKLLADWDVWKFEYGDDTRFFQVAFNAYDFTPDSEEWFNQIIAHKEDVRNLIEQGKTMIKYRDSWAKNYMKKGFETTFHEKKCFAVNIGFANSEYFKSLETDKYDILIAFSFDGSIWSVSMYSTTTDVSEIAKLYGGGGHKGASGFQCKELPFCKEVIV